MKSYLTQRLLISNLAFKKDITLWFNCTSINNVEIYLFVINLVFLERLAKNCLSGRQNIHKLMYLGASLKTADS